MPKAKPVSLHPLSFEEAITALIRAGNQENAARKKAKDTKPPKKK